MAGQVIFYERPEMAGQALQLFSVRDLYRLSLILMQIRQINLPVSLQESQATTKIKPVFNCSFTEDKYSVNEAVYTGVNLINTIVEILLRFQIKKYVMLRDIRKAFLMIKLKREEDKNRFSFFLKDGDELLCYRYNALIFGFTTSPFILNYILKYHIGQYQPDEYTEILKNNLFLDNTLVYKEIEASTKIPVFT